MGIHCAMRRSIEDREQGLGASQQTPKPPKFVQPGLSRSNGGHPQREGTTLGVFVPSWYFPGVTLRIWVCLGFRRGEFVSVFFSPP